MELSVRLQSHAKAIIYTKRGYLRLASLLNWREIALELADSLSAFAIDRSYNSGLLDWYDW